MKDDKREGIEKHYYENGKLAIEKSWKKTNKNMRQSFTMRVGS